MIKQVHEATHLFSLMILSIQATHISKFLFPLYITHQYINIMINQVPGNNNSIYNIDKKKKPTFWIFHTSQHVGQKRQHIANHCYLEQSLIYQINRIQN